MTNTETCACCGDEFTQEPDNDPWEGRMDDYCWSCRLMRCDAYPGECAHDAKKRAQGGPVPRGQQYLVGDKGPETFRPLR